MARYIAQRCLLVNGKMYEPGEEVKLKKSEADRIAGLKLGGHPILKVMEEKKKGGK
jgi:hypothetical protein